MSLKMMMNTMSPVQLQPRNSKNSTSTVLNNVVGLQTLLLLDSTTSAASSSAAELMHRPLIIRTNHIIKNITSTINNVVLVTKLDDRLAVLKYCNLCCSKLSPNKDVYMYR
ncbi:hypothetical protein LINPERHAP1_LOCUS32054 [Linum perenne]